MCEHSLFVTCNHAPLDASGSVGIRTMRQKLTDLLRAPDYVISELLFNSIQLNNIWFVLGLTIGIATVQLDRNLDVDLDRKWANQMWKQVCMRKGTRPLLGINMQGLMFNALSKWRIVISGANRDQWPNISYQTVCIFNIQWWTKPVCVMWLWNWDDSSWLLPSGIV